MLIIGLGAYPKMNKKNHYISISICNKLVNNLKKNVPTYCNIGFSHLSYVAN